MRLPYYQHYGLLPTPRETGTTYPSGAPYGVHALFCHVFVKVDFYISVFYFVFFFLRLLMYMSFFYVGPRVGLSILIETYNVNTNLVTKIFRKSCRVYYNSTSNFFLLPIAWLLFRSISLLTGIRRKCLLVAVSISLCYK